jgi:hypothetical protein
MQEYVEWEHNGTKHSNYWCLLGAAFPALAHFIEMSYLGNHNEEEVLAFGRDHRIAELMAAIEGVEAGVLPASALDEWRRKD